MYDNYIEIKEHRKGLISKGLIFLALMIISLLVAFCPILFNLKNGLIFYACGGISFVLFLLLYLFQIIKACKPSNALVLSSRGFTDFLNVGNSIEIEWTNISSVKMLGKGETQFLGIVLENSDIIISKMNKNRAAIMRENIEEGLPAILIAQTEVRTPIKELRDLFVRFVRESRVLENEPPQRTKVNPFSSDDVLRAFGKLPAKENNDSVQEKTTNDIIDTTVTDNSNDSFYNTLKEKTSEANDSITENNEAPAQMIDSDSTNYEGVVPLEKEEVPQEIAELLAKAKSSKISEIGKILSENDVPYAVSRQEQNDNNNQDAQTVALDNIIKSDTNETSEHTETIKTKPASCDDIDLNTTAFSDANTIDHSNPSFVFPEEFYKKDAPEEMSNHFENNLESMILKAFNEANSNETKESVKEKDSAKEDITVKETTDAKDYYPDLVFINDSDFDDDDDSNNRNRFIKEENSYTGDFITNIDDD